MVQHRVCKVLFCWYRLILKLADILQREKRNEAFVKPYSVESKTIIALQSEE